MYKNTPSRVKAGKVISPGVGTVMVRITLFVLVLITKTWPLPVAKRVVPAMANPEVSTAVLKLSTEPFAVLMTEIISDKFVT